MLKILRYFPFFPARLYRPHWLYLGYVVSEKTALNRAKNLCFDFSLTQTPRQIEHQSLFRIFRSRPQRFSANLARFSQLNASVVPAVGSKRSPWRCVTYPVARPGPRWRVGRGHTGESR